MRQGLCSVAGRGATPEPIGWQTVTWPHFEDGAARYQATVDYRCDGRRPMGLSQRRTRRFVACTHPGEETADAGRHCPRQQKGAGHPGNAGQTGRLSGSDGARRGTSAGRPEPTERRGVKEDSN